MDLPLADRRPATYADLVALPTHLKGEILDGRLYTQPRPRDVHMMLAGAAFYDLYGKFHRGHAGPSSWWVVIEPGIELPRSPEFSPDSAGWRRDRVPRRPDRKDTWRVVPDWIFEVLSPSNRVYDLTIKRRFYAEIGVQHLWYLDPDTRSVLVSRLVNGAWLDIGEFTDAAPVRMEPFDAVELDLREWWD